MIKMSQGRLLQLLEPASLCHLKTPYTSPQKFLFNHIPVGSIAISAFLAIKLEFRCPLLYNFLPISASSA
jgi:hypothetical protein